LIFLSERGERRGLVWFLSKIREGDQKCKQKKIKGGKKISLVFGVNTNKK